MQETTIVLVFVSACSLVTAPAHAQDGSASTDPAGDAPSSIILGWPAAEGGELQLVVIDSDGAPRTVEQEPGQELLVLAPQDLQGQWSVCVMNPTDLFVPFTLTVTIAGRSRTFAGARDPHVAGPCQPASPGFVTSLTLGAPSPQAGAVPPRTTRPVASSASSAVLHLRHDMGGHQHVDVDQNGDHSECETPCVLPVAPGHVHLRAGRFDGEIVADVGRQYFVSVDVGWDTPSYVLWIAGNVLFYGGALGVILLPSINAATRQCMPGFGGMVCSGGGLTAEDWYAPLLWTAIAMVLVGAPICIAGLADGTNGAAHVSNHEPQARLGLDGLTVTW